LKTLPKAILILAVVGCLGYIATKLDVGQFLSSQTGAGKQTAAQGNPSQGTAGTNNSQQPTSADANHLAISINSFHGFAPGILANGGSLTTRPGSIFDKLGLNLKLVIQDNIPAASEILTSRVAQCWWRTSDFWAQEQPNLRNSGYDGRAVVVIDNTQGADAVIAKDPNIRSIEDLAGKSVALLQFTPSHGLLLDAIENSSLTGKRKASVKLVFINADEGTAGVRAALESGAVDAAVLFDPDLSLAIKSTRAHVIYSTKQATNLIFDTIVCDKRLLDTAAGQQAIQKLVTGWMQGVDLARSDLAGAAQAVTQSMEVYGTLAKTESQAFIKNLFNNLVLTDITDNARILGLTGDTNHYERVYRQFDQVYRAAGALANPSSPVIDPAQSFDYRYIRSLITAQTAAAVQRSEPVFTENARERDRPATLTKPIQINFASGSAELNARAKKMIDTEMVPFLDNNGGAYIELSGNADSTGSAAVNKPLSLARAQAVAAYLMQQWEIPAARLKVVGNGSDKPICNEGSPEGLSLDECRALNRTTRIGILSR
jgi:outer membrane protein OmpA-like peptidoglycan-associated protein/ABC-type nitrate/sulfonate/bicarbonate transport system substrate-binding protein